MKPIVIFLDLEKEELRIIACDITQEFELITIELYHKDDNGNFCVIMSEREQIILLKALVKNLD